MTAAAPNVANQARVLIADSLPETCVALLKEGGMEVTVKTGQSEEALCAMIGEFDGLIVRSATQVTAKVFQAAKRLKVVGRAGVGVDNIDVEAATKAGVAVENTPFGNITSAAEHAVAMAFAVVRNIPRADQQMKAGVWDKKTNTGMELDGKILGIIGYGKVGAIVARILEAARMTVQVFDPYLTAARAQEFGVKKVELDDLLKTSDLISIHTPLNDATRNLLNADNLRKMKKSAYLVNCARGGIVDEAALKAVLDEGKIAGAAVDVFGEEPYAKDGPLTKAKNIILTPHLGASTKEAQEKVSQQIAEQFVLYFRDGEVRNAVNLSVTLDPKLAPWAGLGQTLGQAVAQMAGGPVKKLTVGFYGKIAAAKTRALSLIALQGLMRAGGASSVTLVNVEAQAANHGIELIEQKSSESRNFASRIELVAEVEAAGGKTDTRTIGGTLFDESMPRITHIDSLSIDLAPAPHLVLMKYQDRPGMVGKLGTILGEAHINIANMAVGRNKQGELAVVALTVDDPVPPAVVEQIRKAIGPERIDTVSLL